MSHERRPVATPLDRKRRARDEAEACRAFSVAQSSATTAAAGDHRNIVHLAAINEWLIVPMRIEYERASGWRTYGDDAKTKMSHGNRSGRPSFRDAFFIMWMWVEVRGLPEGKV